MKKFDFFIEVSTLFDDKPTGISNVNMMIVEYLYKRENVFFFYKSRIVKKDFINKIIKDRKGPGLNKIRSDVYECNLEKIRRESSFSIGIFTNIKEQLNYFDYEIQIIHDLTFLITPEFHTDDTIGFYSSVIEENVRTNDLNVCVSNATMQDIIIYLDVSKEKAMVSHLGVVQGLRDKEIYSKVIEKYQAEKFIICLGTLEPRKNVNLILKYLEQNPNLLKEYLFIFVGKEVRGESFNERIEKLKIEKSIKKRRIKYFGYLNEEEKNILLMNAEFLIYPSFYEGFGIPVLEALSIGCPVLSSFSSSLPEVGGDVAYYFDPTDLNSFKVAFNRIYRELERNKEEIVANCLNQAKKFPKERFIERILKRIAYDLKLNSSVDLFK